MGKKTITIRFCDKCGIEYEYKKAGENIRLIPIFNGDGEPLGLADLCNKCRNTLKSLGNVKKGRDED